MKSAASQREWLEIRHLMQKSVQIARDQEECRIAEGLQKHGMSRPEALREAARILDRRRER